VAGRVILLSMSGGELGVGVPRRSYMTISKGLPVKFPQVERG
jgi:hypothetical protein